MWSKLPETGVFLEHPHLSGTTYQFWVPTIYTIHIQTWSYILPQMCPQTWRTFSCSCGSKSTWCKDMQGCFPPSNQLEIGWLGYLQNPEHFSDFLWVSTDFAVPSGWRRDFSRWGEHSKCFADDTLWHCTQLIRKSSNPVGSSDWLRLLPSSRCIGDMCKWRDQLEYLVLVRTSLYVVLVLLRGRSMACGARAHAMCF